MSVYIFTHIHIYYFKPGSLWIYDLDNIASERKKYDAICICMKAQSHIFPSRSTAVVVFHTVGAAIQHGIKQKL